MLSGVKERSRVWRSAIGAMVAFGLYALACASCHPSYSAPVAPLHAPSPGRSEEGTLSAQGTWSGGFMKDLHGSVGYAPVDHLQLELGGQYVHDFVAVGNLTARASAWPAVRQDASIKFLNDLELGLGLGVGGELYGNEYSTCMEETELRPCDHRDWNDRFLYGGFGGVGLGVGFDWSFDNRYVRHLEFDVFGRLRYQLTKAYHVPQTQWVNPMGGVQFRFNRQVRLGLVTTWYEYWNAYDQDGTSSLLDITLGFDFDLLPKDAAPEASTPVPVEEEEESPSR